MSKSKIENRLNTMRHKQAQPTDSLILAESVEGKDFSQELSKAQPFDEIPSLTEKQVAFGMCNPQAHLDAGFSGLRNYNQEHHCKCADRPCQRKQAGRTLLEPSAGAAEYLGFSVCSVAGR